VSKRKTLEEFKLEVEKIYKDEYKITGDYKNNKEKIFIKHKVCGNSFLSIPKDLLNKKGGCPICARRNLTSEDLIKELPNDYTYIKGFKSYKSSCYFKHEKCGYEFLMEPSKLVGGRGCPKCGGTKKKTNEEFLEEIKNLQNSDQYVFLEEYVNDFTKLNIRHNCGYEYAVAPTHFLKGRRCPVCEKRNSYAIRTIRNILNESNIQYENEHSPGIKGVGNGFLKYDIFIPSKNLLMEFDGEQHFKMVFHKSLEKFKNEHANDIIKNDYIKQTNFTLIRIPYIHNTRVEKIIKNIIDEKSSETIEKYKLYSINKEKENNLENYYKEYKEYLVEYTQASGSGELLTEKI
jgi:hypothetical protein